MNGNEMPTCHSSNVTNFDCTQADVVYAFQHMQYNSQCTTVLTAQGTMRSVEIGCHYRTSTSAWLLLETATGGCGSTKKTK